MAQHTNNATPLVTLPADNQILITREFDAPKHLVYRAWTTPELIKQWWSGDRGEVVVADVDLRAGGAWRYAMAKNDDGFEVAFHGEFHEIVPNERIVSTEIFEGAPEETSLNTLVLTEVDGRTTLSILCEFSSQEVRDAVIATGMEGGLKEAMDHLEKVAASLR